MSFKDDLLDDYTGKVIEAVEADDAASLLKILSSLEDEDDAVRRILSHVTVDEDGQESTPLFAAIMRGNERVAELILDKFQIDLELTVTMKIDDIIGKGVTVLWCAAHMANFGVIKCLIEHGADVNHCTASGSSPVRVACFDCDCEAIEFLVNHGADINLPNNKNTTGLHISADRGRLEVVQLLQQNGADINMRNVDGDTALHRAAMNGHLDIVKFLCESGAAHLKNNDNFTPTMAAANECQYKIVEYLISVLKLGREEKIQVYQLLGTSFIEESDIEIACGYLKMAIQEREKEPRLMFHPNTLQGDSYPELFEDMEECKTVEELEILQQNSVMFFLHSLVLKEIVLGPLHKMVVGNLEQIGALFADKGLLEMCVDLWMHAFQILRVHKLPLSYRLLGMCEIFSEMILRKCKPKFADVQLFLIYCCEAIETAQKEQMKFLETDDYCPLFSFIYCTVIALKVRKSPEEFKLLTSVVRRCIKLKPTLDNGYTFLHVILDPFFQPEGTTSENPLPYASDDLCRCLIGCGADVNARDKRGNSLLHVLALGADVMPKEELVRLVSLLTGHGAHVDIANSERQTPEESTPSLEARNIFRAHRTLKLKCLASSVIMEFTIPFTGEIPQNLEAFVKLH